MEFGLSGVLALGLVIGLQHALEADHLAAVSALVSGEKSRSKIIRHGAFWGIGHSLTLMLVAGTAVFLGGAVEGSWASWLEFLVGVMLVGLGGNVLWRLWRDRIHFHTHAHGDGTVHFHAHSHADQPEAIATKVHSDVAHDHTHKHDTAVSGQMNEGLHKGHVAKGHVTANLPLPWRSLSVGLMHGMAGSAALIVLTASQMASPLTGLAYVALFGIGSIIGMALLSAVISIPLGWTAKALTRVNRLLQGGIGAATVGLGLVVMYDTQVSAWLAAV